MKAMTVAAVATATVASNISYAQPAPVFHMPTALPGSLRYLQPEDAPQMKPALTSHLNSAQQTSPPENQSVSSKGGKGVARMISKPKTPIEFVRNFKVIFDNDLLLQDAFYAEVNLKDIFNLESLKVSNRIDGSGKSISIVGRVSEEIFPRIKASEFFGGSTSGADFVGGRTDQLESIRGGLNFGMYEGGPDFDAAMKIFGKIFFLVPPQPSPHGGPSAATASHGNETWKFEQVDERTDRAITIGFIPAGRLSSVLIQVKKTKK